MSLLKTLLPWCFDSEQESQPLSELDKKFLAATVNFYRALQADDRVRFEQRCLLFLQTAEVIGHQVEVDRHDELLVASGSVILAWGFSKWHYVRVGTVILVPSSFNDDSEFGKFDSNIQGLVGSHHLAGKMIISKPALHAGFRNDRDMRNVILHEFAHLIDMADGDADGFPEQLSQAAFSIPWLSLIEDKIKQIRQGNSNIRDYGATNSAEFFAVASEYFFERPAMMKKKHPQIYQGLVDFYQQDRAELLTSIKPRKKQPCPCGSGKRYKRCCLPV